VSSSELFFDELEPRNKKQTNNRKEVSEGVINKSQNTYVVASSIEKLQTILDKRRNFIETRFSNILFVTSDL